MSWIFAAFLVGLMIHMIEEYIFPGDFMNIMKHINPKFAPLATTPMAVIINGLQSLLCTIAVVIGQNLLVFSMAVGGCYSSMD